MPKTQDEDSPALASAAPPATLATASALPQEHRAPHDSMAATIEMAVPPSISDPLADPVVYDQFALIDLRVGLIKTAERIPKKDKLLKLSVDVGEHEPRTIIAGIGQTFAPDALVGLRVVVVANLAPRDFGKGLISHGMLLATGPSDSLHLATIGDGVTPGSRLK